MGQQLRDLVSLTEDPATVPSTNARQLTTTYSSNSRKSKTLFWPPQALAHIYYTHIHSGIPTQTNKINLKSLKIKCYWYELWGIRNERLWFKSYIPIYQANNESHVLVSFTCPSHPSYESSERTVSVEELLWLRQDSKGKLLALSWHYLWPRN